MAWFFDLKIGSIGRSVLNGRVLTDKQLEHPDQWSGDRGEELEQRQIIAKAYNSDTSQHRTNFHAES